MMTKLEKAIKGLKCCTLEKCPGKECPYVPPTYEEECVNVLCADALELLKEQGPIKPTVAVDTWICSCCGHTLESQELIDDKENPQVLVHEIYSFCPNCGKAVKWE